MIELTCEKDGIIELRMFKYPEDLIDWLFRESFFREILIKDVNKYE